MQASELAPLVAECCTEVLDAMYFTAVLSAEHLDGHSLEPEPGVVAFSLRFRGDVRGTFGLSLGEASARTLAANFLGEEEESLIPAEIAEVIGELANMLCGSVVSRIGGKRKYALSHPQEIAANTPSPHALVSTLETDTGIIRAWIALEAPRVAAERSVLVLQETVLQETR